MSKVKSVTCPKCGAVLTVDDGLDYFFCMHCGQKIGLSDNPIKMDIKTDHTIRWVNQAKLEKERAEREKQNKPMSKQDIGFMVGIVVFSLILMGGFFFWSIISKLLGV